FDPSAMITVRVGEETEETESKDFLVHESILSSRSEFFRRAMNGKWPEADTRVVELSEDDPDLFGIYLNHVYTEKLPVGETDSDQLVKLDYGVFYKETQKEYDLLFRLYIFGEKVQDTLFKNDVITSVHTISSLRHMNGSWSIPTTAAVALVYDGTPEASPARRLIVDLRSDITFQHMQRSKHGSRFEELPKEY
ncbi:hypothetical protein BDV95DRAFT_499273, partial [Massariosphaeria phaeospora]